MPESLNALTRDIGPSPRRGVLSVLATVGVGALFGGRGAPSAEAKKKGKKGKDKCKKCPSCEECADFCQGVFIGAGGQRICADKGVRGDCIPCSSNSDCIAVDSDYPYCVTEFEQLATGEKLPLSCEGSTQPGLCAVVYACGEFT